MHFRISRITSSLQTYSNSHRLRPFRKYLVSQTNNCYFYRYNCYYQQQQLYIQSRSASGGSQARQQQSQSPTIISYPLDIKSTSGRSRKRSQRRSRWNKERRRRQRESHNETPKHHYHQARETTVGQELLQQQLQEKDHRTWRTILFPPVYSSTDGSDHLQDQPIPWPKSFSGWYKALSESWIVYKGTWEGFMSSSPSRSSTDDSEDDSGKNATDLVMDNAKNNLDYMKTEGDKVINEIQSKTGIYTLEDLKTTAKEYMTVATLMLTEFMKEYRKGRDEEVDKMLHEYFQQQQEQEQEQPQEGDDTVDKQDNSNEKHPKRRRRQPKRRRPT